MSPPKKAPLGIAIATGSDVAIESCDVTLVSGDIKGVATAIRLSRQTFKLSCSSSFWAAFGYNAPMMP